MGGTACESVEPGDYVVYRVSSTSEQLSDGCYWEYQGADANVRHDSNTLQSSNTFVLYAGVDAARYLDMGELTLDGEYIGDQEAGEGYEFEGKSVDVNWDNPEGSGSGAKRTTTIKTSVDMTVDGALAFGEVKIKSTYSCTGTGCGEMPPPCTRTIEFVGTEVEDVTLHHDVPAGLGDPSTTPPDDDDGSGGAGAGGTGGTGGAGGDGGGPVGMCVDDSFGEPLASEGDCQAACEILFCCAASECEPVTSTDKDLFLPTCLSSCSEQQAMVAVVNGGDCPTTVATVRSADTMFADTFDSDLGE
jgi:hypothetical protein